MRKLFFLFCLAILTISACKKEEIATDQNLLLGKWKLIKTSGTIIGNGITTDWNILEITAENAKFFKDNNFITNANYNLDKATDKITFIFGPIDKPSSILDLRSDPIKNYRLEGKEKLFLESDCCDRVNYEMIKF